MRWVLFELFRVSVAMMIQLATFARLTGYESGTRQGGSFDENENVLIITEMIDRLDEKGIVASSPPPRALFLPVFCPAI